MPSVTRYPGTIMHEPHTSEYTSWQYISGIKNSDGSDYGYTNLITGKNGDHPKISPITCKTFNFNIPLGSKITSIVVELIHRKKYEEEYNYPSIAAPKLTLQNAGIPAEYASKTGHTPQQNQFTSKTLTWREGLYEMPSPEMINSNGFGVTIAYPQNTSSNPGRIHINFLRVTINYEVSTYSLQLLKSDSSDVNVGVVNDFKLMISDLKGFGYSPPVLIELPNSVSVESISGDNSTNTVVDSVNNTIVWTPNLQNSYSNELLLRLVFSEEGSQTISVTEQANNTSVSLVLTVYPYSLDILDIEGEFTIYTKQDVDFVIPVQIPVSFLDQVETIYLIPSEAMSFKNGNSYTSVNANGNYPISVSNFDEEGYFELTAKTNVIGITSIGLSMSTTAETSNFVVKCISSSLTYPSFTVMKLSEEECSRLGDGYTYTLNSALKINCELEHVNSFTDYYRNFRMGVVNTIEDTNDLLRIFDACTNFSDAVSSLNTYESKSLEFIYNEEYPVYLLFVGNYPVNNYFTLDFSYPCLVESLQFEGYDTKSVFPAPLLNINDAEGLSSVSELDLALFDKTNSIIFYQFPLGLNFGTGNDKAVRGIQVILDVDVESPITLVARLKSNNGIIGSRSIIITPEDRQIILGDEFDLWGFSIADMVDLDCWELELELNNNQNEESTFIAIENITMNVFFLDLKENKVNMIVDGENMRYYGFFVQKATLNPGLKSKTKYVEVDGSDLHEPASMNIDKKEIEVEFRVVGCTIEETTALLRQIAKKLTNKRTKLNKPIPKRVEFTHVPDFHFDYVLETPIDEDPKTVGYESKLKLVVYDGTSWANTDTVTNTVGSNMGITKVPPIIQFMPLSENVEIIESVHDQKLAISNPEFDQNCIVELRCADKKAYMRTTESDELINITDCVDWDADWFVLYPGEYSFEGNGTCIIQNVVYTERGA